MLSQAQDDSNSASQDGQRQVGQPSAPVESIFVVIDSVDGFIDPQKTDNALNVRGVWYDNNPSFNYSLTILRCRIRVVLRSVSALLLALR